MRSRRKLALFCAVVVLMGVLGVSRAAATSVAADRIGWWTSSPTASPPDEGIAVGRSILGISSLGALHTVVPSDSARLVVRLVGAGGIRAGALRVRACATTSTWSPATGGPLEDAPTFDCTDAVAFAKTADGSWSGDLSPLVDRQTQTVDVAFVPAEIALRSGAIAEGEFKRPVLEATGSLPLPSAMRESDARIEVPTTTFGASESFSEGSPIPLISVAPTNDPTVLAPRLLQPASFPPLTARRTSWSEAGVLALIAILIGVFVASASAVASARKVRHV